MTWPYIFTKSPARSNNINGLRPTEGPSLLKISLSGLGLNAYRFVVSAWASSRSTSNGRRSCRAAPGSAHGRSPADDIGFRLDTVQGLDDQPRGDEVFDFDSSLCEPWLGQLCECSAATPSSSSFGLEVVAAVERLDAVRS